jgi:hypothetical protein
MSAKKTNIARMPKNANEDASALHEVAKELRPLYQIETLSENIGEIASALHSLAKATAMSVIAEHGNDDERAKAVECLKRWFEEF